MGKLSWPWWPRRKTIGGDEPELSSDRRHLLAALSAMAGGGALAAMPQPAAAQTPSDLPPPKRA